MRLPAAFIALAIGSASVSAQDEKALAAMKPFQAFVGEYDTVSKVFKPDGGTEDAEKGKARYRMRALGYAFSIEKSAAGDGNEYDDIMVFQYDTAAGAVSAYLFMPWAPRAREIDVEVSANKLVLNYRPSAFGQATIVTRETVTLGDGGKIVSLIEREGPDGAYYKKREITATPRAARQP